MRSAEIVCQRVGACFLQHADTMKVDIFCCLLSPAYVCFLCQTSTLCSRCLAGLIRCLLSNSEYQFCIQTVCLKFRMSALCEGCLPCYNARHLYVENVCKVILRMSAIFMLRMSAIFTVRMSAMFMSAWDVSV